MLWIISEICYYLGLTLAGLLVPAVTLILWLMSTVDRAAPNYHYLLLAWTCAMFLFVIGVAIKRRIARHD